jgi:hypothetical protein
MLPEPQTKEILNKSGADRDIAAHFFFSIHYLLARGLKIKPSLLRIKQNIIYSNNPNKEYKWKTSIKT